MTIKNRGAAMCEISSICTGNSANAAGNQFEHPLLQMAEPIWTPTTSTAGSVV
ncbi:MAG: hypothetical protein IPK27_03635 [Rhodanobacteraceae bacterium]|nr:hypothetical protein [Rhodanobacteraceae bacterium]